MNIKETEAVLLASIEYQNHSFPMKKELKFGLTKIYNSLQKFLKISENGIFLKLKPAAGKRLKKQILGYSSEAGVMQPENLRIEIAKEITNCYLIIRKTDVCNRTVAESSNKLRLVMKFFNPCFNGS